MDLRKYIKDEVPFETLLNKKIIEITGLQKLSDKVIFKTENEIYLMYHQQDCCEDVSIDDVIGYVDDLINSEILLSEEVTREGFQDETLSASCTWTFYKLSTIKGSVTIRWYGESNGAYSEEVGLYKLSLRKNYSPKVKKFINELKYT